MSVPENFRYTSDHEWVLLEGEVATVGITHHAQDELTDIVFVELPEVGRECETEEAIAVVESVKAASDIFAPVAGEIVEANGELESDPALVNTDPHAKGWIFKIKVSDPAEVAALMDAAAYSEFIGA
ncbi:glycine cleavage system protein GcvH [Rubritalea profundi]|uniref:Glycine cleavage system H protein n=1 Tax=Rubritalea profundi TaxID=1658618 RepID=A0A2S7U4Y0_9BACT|nr:glycine cleavage system protein H [Rubritalea profundi]